MKRIKYMLLLIVLFLGGCAMPELTDDGRRVRLLTEKEISIGKWVVTHFDTKTILGRHKNCVEKSFG